MLCRAQIYQICFKSLYLQGHFNFFFFFLSGRSIGEGEWKRYRRPDRDYGGLKGYSVDGNPRLLNIHRKKGQRKCTDIDLGIGFSKSISRMRDSTKPIR